MLRQQAEITSEGMDALTAWAAGDGEAATRVREAEHRADVLKRALRVALKEAFITPIGAEDIFVLSERLDAVMNGAKDAVRESEVMALPPDEAMVGMAALLGEGVLHLIEAFKALEHDETSEGKVATDSADKAIAAQRQVERVYRKSMSALLANPDLREVMGRREVYRRFSRLSEAIGVVAERVWYASVKET
jgi:hypothetical protein